MAFNSLRFVVFFIAVLMIIAIIDRFASNSKIRNVVLLSASLLFYALFNVLYLLLLIFVIAYTYFFSKRVKEKPYILTISVVLSISILFIFKHFNFFVDSFTRLFNIHNLFVNNLLLPIGISFYLFKSISYLIDIKRGKTEVESDLIVVALYLSFFPEVVAGPISRFNDLSIQFKKNTKINKNNLSIGLQIFLIGLFKKIVLADNIAVFVNEVYRAPKIYSSITIILCIVAYSFQIYLDFSGYSDMAIGCSKMLGYDIKRNFNMPYLSHNVTEFWKRWHISLSTWLQDYLYIPLGGNRKGEMKQYINLIITMVIGGLWHGSKWTFVLWGLINGIALVVHKLFIKNRKKNNSGILSILITFVYTSLIWVLFRADNLQNAVDLYLSIFNNRGINYIHINSIVSIIVCIVAMVYSYVKNKSESKYIIQDLNTIKGLTFVILLIGLIIGLAYTGANPFIYASF